MLGLTYKPLGSTFAALTRREHHAVLSYSPVAAPSLVYRIVTPVQLTAEEVRRVGQKLDRIHQFHLGATLGVVQKMRAALAKQALKPDAARFRTECQEMLDDLEKDLHRVVQINGLNAEQFEFFDEAQMADEHLYSAELTRNDQAARAT